LKSVEQLVKFRKALDKLPCSQTRKKSQVFISLMEVRNNVIILASFQVSSQSETTYFRESSGPSHRALELYREI